MYHAYYSWEADEFCGAVEYTDAEGKIVRCTAVFDNREDAEKGYHWPGIIYLGEVVKFVRRVSRGVPFVEKLERIYKRFVDDGDYEQAERVKSLMEDKDYIDRLGKEFD